MWWFFLIQAAPLPEHLIGLDPQHHLGDILSGLNKTPGALTPEAVSEYVRCFCCTSTIHATCEDFRAAADIGLEMDEADERAGNKIVAPVHAHLVVRSPAFDLVLGPTRLPDGRLYSLLNLLEGSGTAMFYSFAVEYGCCWLPALQRGQKCFRSPALLPSQFMSLLNEMIRELREVPMAPERPPLPAFREELCRITPIGNAKQRLVIVKCPE
jgi:hypothetical protein